MVYTRENAGRHSLSSCQRPGSSSLLMGHDGAFNILALDGGGIRGVYAAHVLAKLEDALGLPLRECFDLIAGTSTGSILAGGASTDIPMATLVDLYESEAGRIFRKRRFGALPHMGSRYSTRPLEQVVTEYLPDVTLNEISTPLMIPSSDITTGGVHVFKSRYLKDLGEPYSRDGQVRLRDSILASCAAPTYFDPRQVGEYLLADGGLWANNPTIIAVTEAVSKFKQPLGRIRVLSIGTGHAASFYCRRRHWGFFTGWGRRKLVSFVLGLQSQSSTNMARLLLGNRHVRLDPEIQSWKLDDVRHLQTMKALADRDFTHHSQSILANLGRIK